MTYGPCYYCREHAPDCHSTCRKPEYLREQEMQRQIRDAKTREITKTAAYFDARAAKKNKKTRRNSVHDRLRMTV